MQITCFECSAVTEKDPQERAPKCGGCGRPFGVPKPGAVTLAYAHKEGGKWVHVHESRTGVHMHDYDDENPIFRVRVREVSDGAYWGWWDHQTQRFTMIYDHPMAVDICFAYGPEAEEARGRGRVCRLTIEEDADSSDAATDPAPTYL